MSEYENRNIHNSLNINEATEFCGHRTDNMRILDYCLQTNTLR